MDLVAVFASITSRLILNLLSADWACIVDHLIVCEDTLHKATDLVELSLLVLLLTAEAPPATLDSLVICGYCINHLLNESEVIRSLGSISPTLVDSLSDRVLCLQFVRVGIVPLSELIDTLVVSIEEDLTVLISSIETLPAIVTYFRALDRNDSSLLVWKFGGV